MIGIVVVGVIQVGFPTIHAAVAGCKSGNSRRGGSTWQAALPFVCRAGMGEAPVISFKVSAENRRCTKRASCSYIRWLFADGHAPGRQGPAVGVCHVVAQVESPGATRVLAVEPGQAVGPMHISGP